MKKQNKYRRRKAPASGRKPSRKLAARRTRKAASVVENQMTLF